jgi:hypothetical protein
VADALRAGAAPPSHSAAASGIGMSSGDRSTAHGAAVPIVDLLSAEEDSGTLVTRPSAMPSHRCGAAEGAGREGGPGGAAPTPAAASSRQGPVAVRSSGTAVAPVAKRAVSAQGDIFAEDQPHSQRQYKQWTEEEEQRLREGYSLYGGAWESIRKNPKLNLRHFHGTQLREKWRNLQKRAGGQ